MWFMAVIVPIFSPDYRDFFLISEYNKRNKKIIIRSIVFSIWYDRKCIRKLRFFSVRQNFPTFLYN